MAGAWLRYLGRLDSAWGSPEESWDSIDRAQGPAATALAKAQVWPTLPVHVCARDRVCSVIRANREAAQPHLYDDDPDFARP